MGLENASDWALSFSGIYFSESPLFPISPIYIPGIRTNSIIRIWCGSSKIKNNWWLAGSLIQLLSQERGWDFEAKRFKIPLHRITLIELPQLTESYQLKFEAARWHQEIEILIEEYSGLTEV